jgi:hypothetical protein
MDNTLVMLADGAKISLRPTDEINLNAKQAEHLIASASGSYDADHTDFDHC